GGLLLLGGRAGDILGRRRMLSVGILVFTAASVLAGLSTTAGVAVAGPVNPGPGAAEGPPPAPSVAPGAPSPGERPNTTFRVYAAMTGIGGGVGLVAGGLLTTYASWRWVFFVNIPIGLPLALGARYALPESQRHPRRWDLPGAIAGTIGFGLLIYGLTRGA